MAKTLKSKLIVIMLDHIKTVKLLVKSSLEIISSIKFPFQILF